MNNIIFVLAVVIKFITKEGLRIVRDVGINKNTFNINIKLDNHKIYIVIVANYRQELLINIVISIKYIKFNLFINIKNNL